MKIAIQWRNFTMRDLTQDTIADMSAKLSDWQKNPQFMRFLKDTPMSLQENIKILNAKLSEKYSVFKLIIEQTKQEIVWFVLFDHFNRDDRSLESYTRVDPNRNNLWIGTQCRKKMIHELLSWRDIQKIVSWHSAWNQWSFVINKRAWFRLVDFVPNNTVLPNIGKITDDFKWEIDSQQIHTMSRDILDIDQKNRDIIMQWIHKHNLWHLI